MSVQRKLVLRQEKVILISVVLIIASVIGVFAYRTYQQEISEANTLPEKAALSVILGDASVKDTVVVYTDPVCDKCVLYHEETLKPLYDEYVATKKIRLEIRPVSIVTEQSAALTELLMCSNEQGKYWQMSEFVNDALNRKNNQTLVVNAATFFVDFPSATIAETLTKSYDAPLDGDRLRSCLDATRYDDKIKQADTQAYAANIYSTPTTFVGEQEPVRGYSIYPFIKSLIDITI